ncbi:hypothetical protein TL16_g06398 [Triparma laevis f. inornata]|uniref:Serine aminopeptidase S33 domain-containing protein n=1 Tax=Triparma laevis f. inornata TaxID=1714386 RepID=A0A9W7AQJ6_9STRA|nr:hypothetical protein TL16_g06398 [Triparma laevis f. inornata]
MADTGCKVWAFDLSGYGDSGGHPTEEIVTEDAVKIYDHVTSTSGQKKPSVYIYGHSLGATIGTKLVQQKGGKGGSIKGLILDSPFVNGTFAAVNHVSTVTMRYTIPFAGWLIKNGMVDKFSTDEILADSHTNVLVLQGVGDLEIPVWVAGGGVLEEEVKRLRKEEGKKGKGSLELVLFDEAGHENVHEQVEFGAVVRKFLKRRGKLHMPEVHMPKFLKKKGAAGDESAKFGAHEHA